MTSASDVLQREGHAAEGRHGVHEEHAFVSLGAAAEGRYVVQHSRRGLAVHGRHVGEAGIAPQRILEADRIEGFGLGVCELDAADPQPPRDLHHAPSVGPVARHQEPPVLRHEGSDGALDGERPAALHRHRRERIAGSCETHETLAYVLHQGVVVVVPGAPVLQHRLAHATRGGERAGRQQQVGDVVVHGVYGRSSRASRASISGTSPGRSATESITKCAPASSSMARAPATRCACSVAGSAARSVGAEPHLAPGASHAHRPDAGVPAFGDVGHGVAHLGHGGRREDVGGLHVAEDHPRRRAGRGYVRGTERSVGRVARAPGLARHGVEGLPEVARRAADPDVPGAQPGHAVSHAVDQRSRAGQRAELPRHELPLVEGLHVLLRRRAAVGRAPALRHRGQRQQRPHVVLLVEAHGRAGLLRRDRDTGGSEGLHEGAHRREAAVIDGGARPVEDHQPQALRPVPARARGARGTQGTGVSSASPSSLAKRFRTSTLSSSAFFVAKLS